MSYKVENICADKKFGSPVRKQIIMFLANKASDDGSGIWCSKGTIQRHTELGESTVKRTITEFLREGLIVESGHRPCKNGYTVVYRIVLDAVSGLAPICERRELIDASTGFRADGVPHGPETGSSLDEEPGPQRTPNHPKTIHKPPSRAREAEDLDFEKAWSAYPIDRRRNKLTCRQRFRQAVENGTDAEEIINAVTNYTADTKSHTRSKVCLSDNWFRECRWQPYVEVMRKAKAETTKLGEEHLRTLVAWVKDRHVMCMHICPQQAQQLLIREMVTREELRVAGVKF